jgi:two-component system sensor histidine kinase and response regulator WspE
VVNDRQFDPFMLDLFHSELETQARVLEAGLVKAEADQSKAAIEPLMRAAHSLKGAARIVTLDLGVKLAHAMEDMLSAAQRGQYRLTSSDVDKLLAANDVFLRLAKTEAMAIPAALAAEADAIESMSQALRDAMAGPKGTPAAEPAPAPAPSPPKPKPAEKSDDGSVRVFVENLNRLTGLAGACLVEARTLRPLSAALVRIKHGQRLLGTAVEQALEALNAGAGLESQTRLEEALRLMERIETLLAAHISEFDRFARKLELLSDRLYDESVMSRMRPFSDGLHGFSRMVRDLAKSLGKSVEFEIRGEATRVDRDILEKLEAPLNHLLRNAIDHGLEPPEARLAAGKRAEGKLVLEARHVSGVLEIVVADDGAGIDLDRLRAKVLERRYATREVVQDLSQAELLDFLFLPGFSTASQVTEVSGRGVGLDIVQSMVREVAGNCRIETRLGQGTRFILQLPLTLSVVRTLLAEIGKQVYAIPLTQIDRILRLPPAELQVVEDRQFCRYGDQTIGLVDAQQVLELPQVPRESDQLSILVLSDRLNRYGLVVDRFLGQRDLAVVPLHPRLGKVPNVSAGAILEDGTPVLILDADDLVRSLDNLLGQGALRKVGQRERAARTGRKRILVVDDSLTVREVERRLLENRGYEVTLAVDGMDGWNALQTGGFDLVVTDVDMPRMDGIELVKRIKGAKHTAAVPVMIVSYKDQEEYRMKGLDAGASYYLTKSSFQDETLVNAVRDLIGEPKLG